MSKVILSKFYERIYIYINLEYNIFGYEEKKECHFLGNLRSGKLIHKYLVFFIKFVRS